MKQAKVILTALFVFYFCIATTSSAQDLTISTNATLDPGTYTYDNVLITNNATLTFNGSVTLTTQNLTIDPGSSISADAKGYPAAQGPGAGKSAPYRGSGAGYGGKGGDGSSGLSGGVSYGSSLTPQDLGSGGGSSTWWYSATGGTGGGAIRLNITNTLTLNGSISANGAGTDARAGAGSGGSIYITTNVLQGSGSFTANGGDVQQLTWPESGGGGAGGRLAIYYQASSFTGKAEAKGGKGGLDGEDGTVVFIDTQNNILYPGHSFKFQTSDSPLNFNKVILNNSNTVFEANTVLVTEQLTLTQSTLTLTGNEIINVNDVLLTNNSTITHHPQGKLYLSASNLTIDSNSSISSNSKGYPQNQGPGAGTSHRYLYEGSGAGYGGKGGDSVSGFQGGAPYGSSLIPQDLGSGGGNALFYGSPGGTGGGAIRLNFSNALTNNGTISSDGGNGFIFAGGGSGGSIYITANTLQGSGIFTSNGGEVIPQGGGAGGAGGRIAIYYKTSTFTGTTQTKGVQAGEDGTVNLLGPSLDVPITSFTLIEKSSTVSTSQETLSVQEITLSNVTVTGDLQGTLNFTSFKLITLTTGPFSGKGFLEANFEANLEGASYKGNWQGIIYPVPSENKLYLKGRLSGDLQGICEASLSESVPASGTFDKFEAVWKLNRLATQTISATLNLEGTLSYQPPYTFTSDIYLYQGNFEGTAFGSYTGPLSSVLTHLRLTGQNEYQGKGFSVISYNTLLGQGEGFSYNQLISQGIAEFQGLFQDPLLGILSATLDENESPDVFSGIIERIDVGALPEPELKVNVWGPKWVSPGQTISYIIEYRNDGINTAQDVAVMMSLSPFVEYVSASEGALYAEGINEVGWNLGDLPAKTVGYLSVQATVIWGLPGHMTFDNYAYIMSFAWHSEKIGTLRSGIKLPRNEFMLVPPNVPPMQMFQYENWRSVASKYNSNWQPILNTQSDPLGLADSLHAALASPVFGDSEGNPIPTDFNGLLQNYDTKDYAIEYSGGGPSGDGALKSGKEILTTTSDQIKFTKYRISPVLFDPDILLPLYKEKGIKKVVLYQSEYDDLLEYNGNIYYDQSTGWKMEIDGFNILFPGLAAKLTGATDVIRLFEQKTGKQVEQLTITMSKGPEGKYGKDKLSIKLSTEPNPIVLYLQGNPKTGELFKQEDFANVEGIEVELRDRSKYKVSHTGWQPWILNGEDIFTGKINDKFAFRFSGVAANKVRVGHDPNYKTVSPEGNVSPGQRLTYRIEYENEGEGIAFGVYFTDTLDTDLDDTTLEIGPVLDIQTGSQIAPAGTYNPNTRTITWFVGEVGSKQGGFANFSINVKDTIPNASEVINFATVYFPSVPEATRTNGTVNIVTTFIDNVPPTTTATLSPQPNQSGWNNTDVTVTLTAQDNENGSGISKTEYSFDNINWLTYTQSFNITNEGITTIYYKSSDNTGNTESAKTLTIKIDKTSPTITATTSPQPNSFGWNNTDVTVTFAAQDTLSDIAFLTQPVTITTEGKDQYIGGEATDFADNQATTYAIINLDKTPPDITLTLKPIKLSDEDDEEEDEDDEGNWYELIYFAQDNLSGIQSLTAGLIIPSLTNYNIELEQDDELNITIDEEEKELEIESPDPEEILSQLHSGLLNLNNNQILQLKIKQGDPKWKIKEKDNKGLEIQAPSIIFKATCSDYAENTVTKELAFRKEKER